MARPAGSTNKTTTTKTAAAKKTVEPVVNNENEELKNRIAELEALVKTLVDSASTQPATQANYLEEEPEIIFKSCFQGQLNLATEPSGNGVTYTLAKFGDEYPIPLSDAKLILKTNKSFIQKGYFEVKDSALLKRLRINIDENILTHDELEGLLKKPAEQVTKIFSKLGKAQQEVVVNMLLRAMANEENVDMNIVSAVESCINNEKPTGAERDLITMSKALKESTIK